MSAPRGGRRPPGEQWDSMKRLCLLALLLAVSSSAAARSGKDLNKVSLAGRDLRGRSFSGVTLTEVDLRGAHLTGADFRGAVYDEFTRWPAGFDPRKRGARLDD
jgi:uncharacterized protein YjbI with pentapeptide repeats